MKLRIIALVVALVAALSSVAAVSAFEAHAINVVAHVENALTVDTAEINYGTVFPQEVVKRHATIALSTSALAELGATPGDLASIGYAVWAECKVQGVDQAGNPIYYPWLGPWLWVGVDAAQQLSEIDGHTQVGALANPCMSAQSVSSGHTLGVGDTSDLLGVTILTPVFADCYNALTDVKPAWFDAVIAAGLWPHLPAGAGPGCDYQTVDLGLDLKIQVTAVNRVPIP